MISTPTSQMLLTLNNKTKTECSTPFNARFDCSLICVLGDFERLELIRFNFFTEARTYLNPSFRRGKTNITLLKGRFLFGRTCDLFRS